MTAFIQARPGEFFSWAEFRNVRPGHSVMPDPDAQRCIVGLCGEVLDPLRRDLGQPVRISRGGGFRSGPYNRLIGGSANSQHTFGEAADISVWGLASQDLVRRIVALGLPFDQAISYAMNAGGHVHVSLFGRNTSRGQRGEVLHCWRRKDNAKQYRRWTP